MSSYLGGPINLPAVREKVARDPVRERAK